MNEARQTGYRVAQVEDATFPVHGDLIWVDCDDDIVADQYWYDKINNTFNLFPVIETVPFEGS